MATGSAERVRVESGAVTLERRRVRVAAALALAASYPAVCLTSVGGPWWGAAAIWSLMGPFALWGAWSLGARERARPGSLEVRGGRLIVERGGKRVEYAAERVIGGMVVPPDYAGRWRRVAGEWKRDPPVPRVEFEVAGGVVYRADVATTVEAEALLAAAGLDVSRRRVRVRAPLVARRVGGGVFGAVLGTIVGLAPWCAGAYHGSADAWIFLLAVVLGTVAGVRATAPPEIVVGADGIALTTAWRKRFIPYASLASIVETSDGLALVHRGGRHEAWADAWVGIDQAHRGALVRRVQEAMSAHASRPGASARAEALARAGRTVAEWREALRALLERASGYRDAPVTRADLEQLVGDPRAPVEQRIAAALALQSPADPAAGERIRVAASACASEPVRVALERAERGDLDEETLDRAVRAAGSKTA